MKCPSCSEDDDKVLESRAVRGGAAIRRRRVCNRCAHRFTTYEEILRDSMMVVKRDGRLEEFSRAKLENGIQRSCLKLPISRQKVGAIVDSIIEELERRYELEIPAQAIGDLAMERLLSLDEVAYVRYASIYRHFKSLEEFVREAQTLRKASAAAAASSEKTAATDEADAPKP
ncbi:MAG: transcriptional repressor NrdR [Kiritimatiellae bacterium]|nr:transcriptional repressor NrdR [Kiritimatiellia bacterium]